MYDLEVGPTKKWVYAAVFAKAKNYYFSLFLPAFCTAYLLKAKNIVCAEFNSESLWKWLGVDERN
jgi:uncharacterized membrane protein (GlpM family)